MDSLLHGRYVSKRCLFAPYELLDKVRSLSSTMWVVKRHTHAPFFTGFRDEIIRSGYWRVRVTKFINSLILMIGILEFCGVFISENKTHENFV